MNKYIVKSLAVSGLGNKVFRCRAEVKENNFPPGRAEELVKSGHLTKVVEEVAAPAKTEGGSTGAEDFSTLTKKQLIAKLQELEVEFDPKGSKEGLLELLIESSAPAKPEEAKDEDETGAGATEELKNALNAD